MIPSKKAIKSSANSAILAEQILQGMAKGDENPISSPPQTKFNPGPNLKNIKVPDSLVESIVGFATNKEEPKKLERFDEVAKVENKISDLVKRLSDLLKEAKQVMSEVTTVGVIASNQKSVLGKKAKNNEPSKINKRN
jgi:hypothetical protein